jgi:hypothetical protein
MAGLSLGLERSPECKTQRQLVQALPRRANETHSVHTSSARPISKRHCGIRQPRSPEWCLARYHVVHFRCIGKFRKANMTTDCQFGASSSRLGVGIGVESASSRGPRLLLVRDGKKVKASASAASWPTVWPVRPRASRGREEGRRRNGEGKVQQTEWRNPT